MQQQALRICPITQNKEEYICTNKNCVKQSKKHLHCYPCLTKMHRDKKQNISHLDDFLDLTKVMQISTQKKEQRTSFLLQKQQQCMDFEKEKVQQIQKYPFYTKEHLASVTEKVEQQIKTFYLFLGDQFSNINKITFYTSESHTAVFELFHSQETSYNATVSAKLQSVLQGTNQYLQQQDLDLHETFQTQKKKFLKLEEKVASLEKPFTLNKLLQLLLLIAFIVIFNNPQFVKFQDITQAKVEGIENDNNFIDKITQQVREKISELQIESTQQFKDLVNQSIQEMIKEIEYLKLYIQKYKIELLEVQKELKDHIQDQKLININFKTVIENLHIQQQEQDEQIKQSILNNSEKETTIQTVNNPDLTLEKLDQKINSTFQKVKEYTEYKIIKHKFYFDAQYNLVGKILIDFPIVLLQGFEKFYDELFSVSFTVQKIVDLNTKFHRQSLICIGGATVQKPSHFALMACDYAFEVFAETFSVSKARKSRTGKELFWYLVRDHSIGFAPTEEIDLRLVDAFDLSDQRRFSHLLDHEHGGGRRIGNQTTLAYSTEHKLVIYVLE